jgi:molybdate transport system ATP-binding protein
MSGIAVVLGDASLELGGRVVLHDLTVELACGAHVLLLGANGAGKTQLLKLLAGERWPTPTGRERREYRDAAGRLLELSELLPRIAHVGGERQDKYLRYDWNFSVERVVATGCHGGDRPIVRLTSVERRRVRGALRRLRLLALRRRRFLTLSYGERRRVLLARALAGRPRLLLLDEPFNGLDSASRQLIARELARLAATGLTIVLATHRAEDAPRGFRRALVLQHGRLVHDGRAGAAARLWLRERAAAAAPLPARRRRAVHPAEPLVTLREVDVYRDYRPVLRGVNWTLGPGEHWALLGGNGSGKTTLLRLVHGDLPAALGGEVLRRGHPRGTHIESWRRRIGFVSPELQAEYLERVSLAELVVSGLRASIGLDAAPRRAELARARRALARVALAADPARPARELSYGQLRLALLARALVLEPEALLLDEPLTGLDAPLRAQVRRLLSALAASGVQLVVAAHHASDLVPEIGHVLTLKGGRARARPRRR